MLMARQQVWVSRVLGDDNYKRIPRVTVGVARWRTPHCSMAMSAEHRSKFQPFIGNDDVSIMNEIF